MKQLIYADNAATTKLNSEAFEAMVPWLRDEYGNASQPYAFARGPKKALAEAREDIARCINALPDEIYFTSGGTESDNWAIKGSAFSDLSIGETITSAIEHHAVLNSCEAISRLEYLVKYLPPDEAGVIHPSVLKNAISNNTRLVSIMLSNNEIGTIEPVQELATIAHKYGAIFHTDAVQAVGHIPIDVNELGVDMLSASAHKFNGPKGIGFLYIRKGTNIIPLSDGGLQESKMRAGTENIASIVGMSKALLDNCNAQKDYAKKLAIIEETLISKLYSANIDFIRNGAPLHIPGSISLSFREVEGETLLHRLDLMGICVSTGSACDSVNTQISHVLKAIKLDEQYARGTIRVTFGKDNTLEDAIIIADAIIKILRT